MPPISLFHFDGGVGEYDIEFSLRLCPLHFDGGVLTSKLVCHYTSG